MAPKAAFLGMGLMGSAMAQNLLRAGFALTVYNRTVERTTAAAKAGAGVALSPSAAVAGAEIVCLCVSNGAAVNDVLFGSDGAAESLAPGTLVIDFSTIAPAEARAIGARLQGRKIRFVDAPVTGGDVGARNATLTIMAGGSADDVHAAEAVFSAVGKSVVHMGPVGSGQLTKCVNQIAVALSVASMTEALVFAQRSGLDAGKVLDAIRGGAAGSWSLENYAPRVLRGDLKPGFDVNLMLKDLRIAASEADAMNLSLPVSSLVKELYTALSSPENGRYGNHALIKVYELLNRRSES